MQDAVHVYHHEQTQELHEQKGAHKIAQEHGIENQWRTIINRYNGGRSRQEAHEEQQKLTPVEEVIIAEFVRESANHGFPMTLHNIEQYANLVQRNRLGANCTPLGENWVSRFLDRHRDILQTHWSKPLDTQWACALNPETKKRWFELVEEFVVKTGVRVEDLYAMDESGCPPSDQGTERVVGG